MGIRVNPIASPFDLATVSHRNPYELICEFHDSIVEKVWGNMADHFSKQTQEGLEELKTLRELKVAAQEAHAYAMNQRSGWDAALNVARYFTCVSSVVLGAALISSGANVYAGYGLAASGGLGLANAVASDLNVWKTAIAYFEKSEEMQRKMANQIDCALALLSLGVSLLSTAYGAPALALVEPVNTAKQIFQWFNTSIAMTTYAGKNWAERSAELTRADWQTIENKATMAHQKLQSLNSNAQDTLQGEKIDTKTIYELITASELNLAKI